MAYRTPTVVALSTALATAAVVAAGPAEADPNNDFLNLLTSAGIAYGNAGDTTDLGRQVCNMLVQPGKDFASTVAEVQNRGVNPDMARSSPASPFRRTARSSWRRWPTAAC
ncbi:hypothetical protein MMUR_23600 [Mycolicibacterium murale]|uniref:DUF732 domain-containing protein n=1 Tax=Mycolicibacterium murale TaxID=182220 RepID=A0A7I9WKK4_9MYCO|nr:DUF732 domain-containing protein [Mycolicibacterium murale]GFG58224.1 hypothetical protein MMUR_23600 [Mycolicibacterium murale]